MGLGQVVAAWKTKSLPRLPCSGDERARPGGEQPKMASRSNGSPVGIAGMRRGRDAVARIARAGRAISVPGGAWGKVARFGFAEGKATADSEFPLLPPGADTFLAGLVVQPETGRLYVCNEAASQVLVIDPGSGKVTDTLAA